MQIPAFLITRRAFVIALPLLLIASMWRVAAQRPKHLPGLNATVTAIAFSSDGRTIACATYRGLQVTERDVGKWRRLSRNSEQDGGGEGAFQSLFFTRRDQFLISQSSGNATPGMKMPAIINSFVVWRLHNRPQTWGSFNTDLGVLAISEDAKKIAIGGMSLSVVNQDLIQSSINIEAKMPPRSGEVYSRRLSISKAPSTGFLWKKSGLSAVAFSKDAKKLAADVYGQKTIAIYDTQSASSHRLVERPKQGRSAGIVRVLTWSPDSRYLAAIFGRTLMIWRSDGAYVGSTDLLLAQIDMYLGQPPTIAFAPDSSRLAVGAERVQIWSVPALKPLRTIEAPGPIAISPDGKTLATGGQNGAHEVLLWPL